MCIYQNVPRDALYKTKRRLYLDAYDKKNIFKKIICFIVLSIILIIILGFCYLFRPFSVFRPEYNSAVDITTYNPRDIPPALIDILSRQTYPAIYVDELEKNTYLIHDSRSIEQAFLHIKVSAKLINRVLYIKIKKYQNVDEADNNTPDELISVITVPDDKYVNDIKIRTEFTPYSPWVNKPQLENIE